MKALSLRARLTAWYAATLIVVLAVAAVVVLSQQERIGLRRLDRELADLGVTVGNVLVDEVRESAKSPAREAIDTLGVRNHAVAIFDESGHELAAAWNGFHPPDAGWRVRTDRLSVAGTTYVVTTAAPLSGLVRERREALEAMAIGIPLVVLLAALGGLWLASVGLRPITDMAARASRIGADGMENVGASDRDDELGQLARAFNGLVARLRAALQTQRQFMADASHELRTPVSVIRSAADVTLSREQRSEAEYREALVIVDTEARRVTRLVDDMLVLARADAGGYPLQRARLYVDELVTGCTRTVAVLARERGVTIRTASPTESALDGDEELLRRMLVNVVQNAVQHTRAGESVAIDVVPNGRRVAIDVTNDGAPIADADRERIFDRFVQLDAARRTSGAGLGLPIARWIAEAHGGALTLKRSGPKATTFSITLPLV